MKKVLSLTIIVSVLIFTLCACGAKTSGVTSSKVTIAIPNDTTNEARALLLLAKNGYIKLEDDTSITSTILNIASNPKQIEFKEVEAAQLPNILKDVDYAVINSNYAISAGLNPTKDSLLIEGSASQYSNILCVKSGNENNDKIKALKAALSSKQVKEYIEATYDGAVVSVVDNPTDGFDNSINYNSLSNQTISIAASPTPHAEILNIAKEILSQKNIKLDIQEYSDYVIPNNVVEDGTVDANFFQHLPYLDDFNKENNTHIVSVGAIHVEPLGLYGGKQKTLDPIKG
ncbi:MAG: MetQ/NlpA family ABC transporter substrate-binding protein [Eubacteriales bacterium]|nr:MetQ/NlpA family ABC transporter substrate-binding protein [Eubacteriales bacterium]